MAAEVEVKSAEVGRSGGRLHLSPLTNSNNKNLLEISPMNQPHLISPEPSKPAPGPKPRLTPKPFTVDRNPTIKPILAPKPQPKPRPESNRPAVGKPELPSTPKPHTPPPPSNVQPKPETTSASRPTSTSFRTSKLNAGQTTKPVAHPFKPAPPPADDSNQPVSPVLKPSTLTYSRSLKRPPSAEWSGSTKKDQKDLESTNKVGTSIMRTKSMGYLLQIGQEEEEKAKLEAAVPLRAQPRFIRTRPASAIFPTTPTKTDQSPNPPFPRMERRPLSADLTSKFETGGLSLHRKPSTAKENSAESLQKKEHVKSALPQMPNTATNKPVVTDQSKDDVSSKDNEELRGASIKSRISLLLDSSTSPVTPAPGQAPDNTPVQAVEAEPAVGVKQLIKQLTVDQITPNQSPVLRPAVKPRPLPPDLTKRFSPDPTVSLGEASDRQEGGKAPEKRGEDLVRNPNDEKTFVDLKDSPHQIKTPVSEGPDLLLSPKESEAHTVRASVFENVVEKHSILMVDDNKVDKPDDEGTLVTATYKEPVSPSGPVRVVHAFDTVPVAEGSTVVSESVPSAQWEDKALTLRSRHSQRTKTTPEKISPEQVSNPPRFLRVGALPKWTIDDDIDLETGMPKDKPREFEVEDVSAAAKRLKTQQIEEMAKPKATYFALTGQMQETIAATAETGDSMALSDPSAQRSSQGKVLPFRRNPSLDQAFAKEPENNTHAESQLEKQKDSEKQAELEFARLKEREMQREFERQRQKAFEKEKQEFAEKQRALEINKQIELERLTHLEFEKQRQVELKRQRQIEKERQKSNEIERQNEVERQAEVERRQVDLEKRRQLELESQRQFELKKQKQEQERLKRLEMERQKQMEIERQRQKEFERLRQIEAEKLKQIELEKQRHIELESQRQADLKKQKQELERQKQLEEEKQRQIELERQRQHELDRQRQVEIERQKQIELDKERQLEREKRKQIEAEKLRQKELERQKQIEFERQRQLELERQKLLEIERVKQLEEEKQRQIEIHRRQQYEAEKLERQRQHELDKQRQAEIERQKQIELDRERQLEREKQKQIEAEKLKQKEIERQKPLEYERQRQLELERQKLLEMERVKQREVERDLQRQLERERREMEREEERRQKELDKERKLMEKQKERQRMQAEAEELERRQQAELQKQRERQQVLEMERQRLREKAEKEQAEKLRQMALEQEMLRLRELDKEKERQREMQREVELQRHRELEKQRQKQLDLEQQELEKQRQRQQEQEKERLRKEELERRQLQEFERQKQAERQRTIELEKRQLWEKAEREEAERMRQVAKQQEAERQRLKDKQKKEEQERIRIESAALRPKVLDLDSVLVNDQSKGSPRSDPSTRWKEPSPKSDSNLRPVILDIDSFTSHSQPSPMRELFPVVGIQEVNPRVPMFPQNLGGLQSPALTTSPQDPWELRPVEMSVDQPELPRKLLNKTSPEQLLLRQEERWQAPQKRWSGLVVDEPFHLGALSGPDTKPAPSNPTVSSDSTTELVWLTRDPPQGQTRSDGPSHRRTQGSQELNRIRSRSMSRRSAPATSAVESSLSRMRSRSAHRDQVHHSGVQQKQSVSTEDESKDSETPVHETDSQYGTWETGLRSEDSLTPATPSSDSISSPSPKKPTSPQTPVDHTAHLSTDVTDGAPPAAPPSELLPLPDVPVHLLDNSALRSRAQLGKKRAPRTRPSRAAKQTQAEGGASDDWIYKDSTEEKVEKTKEDSDSEEQSKGLEASPAAAPSQPQRVALFPGVDPSALMAQLKKRGDSDNQTEGATPPPSQLSRSPKSPFLPRATRVLPPAGGKENGEEDSPQWLKELKSKKRLSQYENES